MLGLLHENLDISEVLGHLLRVLQFLLVVLRNVFPQIGRDDLLVISIQTANLAPFVGLQGHALLLGQVEGRLSAHVHHFGVLGPRVDRFQEGAAPVSLFQALFLNRTAFLRV